MVVIGDSVKEKNRKEIEIDLKNREVKDPEKKSLTLLRSRRICCAECAQL